MSGFTRRLQQAASGQPALIRLYLTPATGTYTVGNTLVVTIREDSLTTPVNSVGVDLTYDASLLQYQSASTSGSNFTTTAQNTGGSGAVHLAVSILAASLTGDQLVGTVTFSVIGSGTTAVTVDGTSGIARSSDSTDVCQARLGANYTIN